MTFAGDVLRPKDGARAEAAGLAIARHNLDRAGERDDELAAWGGANLANTSFTYVSSWRCHERRPEFLSRPVIGPQGRGQSEFRPAGKPCYAPAVASGICDRFKWTYV